MKPSESDWNLAFWGICVLILVVIIVLAGGAK